MLYLGLREEEALHLKWRGFSEGYKTYTHDDTKGFEAVALPVHEEILGLLQFLPKDSEWVLPQPGLGIPHEGQFTKKAIARAGNAIGVVGLTPHRMRGTCATLMARAGVNAFTIKKALRHKDIATTERYVQMVEDDIREAQAVAFAPPSPNTVPMRSR